MENIDSGFLLAAIVVISSALIFYSIGVWGERIEQNLKLWHVIAFLLGVTCDIIGTSLMIHIAKTTGAYNMLHAIIGYAAVALMVIHAVWAVGTYARGSIRNKANFSRFSIVVWAIWLIPYCIGVYIGLSH